MFVNGDRSPALKSPTKRPSSVRPSRLIVEELRVEGLIEEFSGESTGGRPPILLSLRTADAVAIGVDVGTNRTIVATSDLAGRVLEQEEFRDAVPMPNVDNSTTSSSSRAN